MVDRLTSFASAIERAKTLGAAGPARIAAPAGETSVAIEDLDIALPDGRHIVEAQRLAFEAGESVLLAGPSGSGKSTMFRSISGIWPYGDGRIRLPAGAKTVCRPLLVIV